MICVLVLLVDALLASDLEDDVLVVGEELPEGGGFAAEEGLADVLAAAALRVLHVPHLRHGAPVPMVEHVERVT